MPPQQPNGEATGQIEAASNGPSTSKNTTNTSHIENGEEAWIQHNGSQSRSSIRYDQVRVTIALAAFSQDPDVDAISRRSGVVDQWFLLALGFFILLASQVQVRGSQHKKKEIVVTYLLVAIIFSITGCTLPTKVLLASYSRWKLHVFIQIQSFLITSAIVYAVVSLCATNPDFMAPSRHDIHRMCANHYLFQRYDDEANQALIVVQSTLGNYLGLFILPLLILNA
ncbi:hypothetical protein ABVK25_000408 [Lepraria finkii]|uniref:Uncharacterized protein n=1 Tax=Lepraria finkii TaxID=1340010 RepID=A0ABR4BQB4_9LECA